MDLDTVTSFVCGIAHFEELPVYGEEQKKIQSKSENRTYCSYTLFSRKTYFFLPQNFGNFINDSFSKKGENMVPVLSSL